MITKVFLDLDGVLADFICGVCEHFNVSPLIVEKNLRALGGGDCVKVAADLCGAPVKDFWGEIDRKFWINLKPLSDADEYFEMAVNRVGIPNVGILTSPGHGPENVVGKLEWIRTYFPDLLERTLVTRSKYLVAEPRAVLIDDWEKIVDSFRHHGGSAILVPRYWNVDAHLCEKSACVVRERLRTV